MRFLSLIGAIGAILAASAAATPLNATISSITKPKLIPVSHVFCVNEELPYKDYIAARDRMVQWAEAGHKILMGEYYRVSSPYNSVEGVTIVVCNHKRVADSFSRTELDQVKTILGEECGEGKGGRVRSKKWMKQWVIVPQRYQRYQDLLRIEVCKCPQWYHCFD
ncbi:hypothetical protein ANO14919_007440 [Xylariales sp. No.14919]|nr:hypothetical protein F5X98DRAFT_385639 [Xylaria grammica]GAW11400.1 hypothetical protein ANO14919_007440 [Xylariales sp. No.14919]